MQLTEAECWRRLVASDHGVLATLHPQRGVDMVPVVYAIDDDRTLLIPVDVVKPKASTRLQRMHNLEADGRCGLLVEHYEDDWQALWWVRVHAEGGRVDASALPLARRTLAKRFPAYREDDGQPHVVDALRLRPRRVTGWQAGQGEVPR